MAALLGSELATIETRRRAARRDGRVSVNRVAVERIGVRIAALDEVQPFDFVGPHLPEVGHPRAVDYFFAAILHQFGFWSPANNVWARPTWATLGGQRLKGSDYCFAALTRQLQADPHKLTPLGRSTLRFSDTEAMFRADDGSVPMPVLATHHALACGYGRDMWELGWEPTALVAQAQEAADPAAWLLRALDHLTGYREDPLRKKSMLLVLALGQRPERFLDLGRAQALAPVVDYHMMRSALRTGLVEVGDEALREALVGRRLIEPRDEAAVRLATFDALDQLRDVSGRDVGAIDAFFFGARRRCPEVEAPDCAACPLDPVCLHDVAMFQPVLRTTAY
jgi:hypothetical protein